VIPTTGGQCYDFRFAKKIGETNGDFDSYRVAAVQAGKLHNIRFKKKAKFSQEKNNNFHNIDPRLYISQLFRYFWSSLVKASQSQICNLFDRNF
jgi:hypothetical protein